MHKFAFMKRILLTVAFMALVCVVGAQPNNPTNPVPLDGGLGLLIAAGAAYGAKKLRDNRKQA